MSQTIAQRTAFLKENQGVNKSAEEINQFKEENKNFFKKIEENKDVSGTSKLKVKGKLVSVNSQKVMKFLIPVYRQDKSQAIKDLVQKKYVKSKKSEINNAFNKAFKDSRSDDELIADVEESLGPDDKPREKDTRTDEELIADIERSLEDEDEPKQLVGTEEEELNTDETSLDRKKRVKLAKLREEVASMVTAIAFAREASISDSRKAEMVQEFQKILDDRQKKIKNILGKKEKESEVVPPPPDFGLPPAPPRIDLDVIDEPRPQQADPVAQEMDFSGETEEQRVEQIENVLNVIESSSLDIPVEIVNSARQGIEIIKTAKSKKSAFSKVKSIAKGVLGFIALSPLPFPPQVKVGAGAILTGITAIEQTVALVKGEETETDAIKAALEAAANVDELAPVAAAATGVINVIDGIINVREAIVGKEENKDGSESTPIPSNLVGEGIENTKAVEATKVGDSLQASEGQLNSEQVNDESASSVEVPVLIMEGDCTEGNIDPKLAKKLAVEAGEGKPEQVETQTELEEETQAPVVSGNQQIQGLYEDPIHPDALGIYFGSSTFPKWDPSLLNDRKDRFKDLSPESVAPFLLQQTKMIWDKYGVDLLIPTLIFGPGSDPIQIEKENMEVLQLWARFNKVSSGEIVGMKLGDLFKFRGLLTEGAGPSVGNPLSSGTPGDQQAQQTELQGQPQPESQPQQLDVKPPHPKDTTKNFLYTPGAVRLGPKVTDAEARKAAVPSLAEITTLQGAPQLQTRRNQTRGYGNAGPAARGGLMNQVRASVIGTASRPGACGPNKHGFGLDNDTGNFNAKVRTG